MKKISFLAALLCASMISFAQGFGVNFALDSNGSSAAASSGNAALAIDGNVGTRWESAQNDAEWLIIDLGQSRTFNYIRIKWEGAYAKQFQLLSSTDGENFSAFYTENNLTQADWQALYFDSAITAQYIKYQGIERATQWGQSFYEFEVYYLNQPPKTYNQIAPVIIVASTVGENDVNRVIDGNTGTEWQGRPAGISGGSDEERTFDAWFVVDLGGFYNVDKVDIMFEGACAQDYHVDFAEDTTNWALGYNFVGNPGVYGRTDEVTELDNNLKVRYVRFWSTKAATEWGMKIFEFRVYGEEWTDSGDTEAPVMVSASLDSKTWNSAVIAVSATDNAEVLKYHAVDTINAIDVKLTPAEGKITVSGLNANTTYNFVITAIDASLNESANSIVVAVTTDSHADAPSAAPTAPTYPANQVKAVYSATYSADCGFGDWGSGTVYTQEEVGKKYVTTNLGYFGLLFDGEGQHLNCANMEALHMDVWIDSDASIRVVPIWGGAEQGKTVNLTGAQWNSIDIPLSDYDQVTSWIDVYQIKIDNAPSLTFWLNNIYFYTTVAPETDSIAPTDFTAEVAETSFFSARIKVHAKDNSGVVKYDAIYDELLVASTTGASDADAYITVPKLAPNSDYSFSIIAKDESGNMAEPIVVAAKTLPVPTSAPAPDFTDKEAVAVFCDALENNPAIAIGQWGQSTIVEPGELVPGDNVYYCSNMNYLGWEFTPHIDATGMEYVHIDFFAPNMTSIQVTPISLGKEGIYTVQLTQNEWTSVDVPLSAYANNGIDWSDIFQFKFMEATPNGKDVFIDNVYFFKSTAEGIEDIETNVKAVKVIENGQLIIIKNGVRYTLMGAELR